MLESNNNRTIIYTDGSCFGNPGPGGWGFLIIHLDGEKRSSCGFDVNTTNNRMELFAAVCALEMAKDIGLKSVELRTDSAYLKRGMTEWMFSWLKNGWRTSVGKEVKNRDLWEKLAIFLNASKIDIKWEWVKGHSKESGNEFVDRLARSMADEAKTKALVKRPYHKNEVSPN